MDWHTQFSPAAQADLNELLQASIQAAATALSFQNLAPFMLVIDSGGHRTMRALGASVRNTADAVMSALQNDDDAQRLRARATVLDVTVRAPFAGDAINIRLEHRDGPAVDVLVPYRTTADGVTIDAEAMTTSVDTPNLWPQH
jgi:hypothetical protein